MYADLAVQVGVAVQKGQTVIINSPIIASELARSITRKAYAIGAKEVIVNYNDEEINHLRLLHAPEEILKTAPIWKYNAMLEYAKEGACIISIVADDPDLLKDVDSKRNALHQKTNAVAAKEYKTYVLSGETCWNIVAHPSEAWANKVFPDASSSEEAIELLWDKIFAATRADQEKPVDAWKLHMDNLISKLSFLNDKSFKTLKFVAPGTDLVVDLPDTHKWIGGGMAAKNGSTFVPNIPTEEVFTLPTKTGVNGTLSSTKPLSYAGNLIDNFKFTFENGKIVDFSAEQGEDVLKTLLDTDEGARFLGEVALVPHDSPISNTNTLFYNTLYDENASCHFAVGSAYPLCLENGSSLSQDDLAKVGANTSITHVDFMVGCPEMSIIGITANNEEVAIFKDGNWAF